MANRKQIARIDAAVAKLEALQDIPGLSGTVRDHLAKAKNEALAALRAADRENVDAWFSKNK